MATEKRLIDAAPIIDECKECSAIEWNKSVYATWAEAEAEFMQRLLDAPVVDAVEVVHGRWEAHKPDCRGYTAGFICSSCGNIVYADYCMKECEYNYCPNCGAKMDGDGNGT